MRIQAQTERCGGDIAARALQHHDAWVCRPIARSHRGNHHWKWSA